MEKVIPHEGHLTKNESTCATVKGSAHECVHQTATDGTDFLQRVNAMSTNCAKDWLSIQAFKSYTMLRQQIIK